MKEKVELILNELIRVYLINNQPISSTKLKVLAELPYSASSIRSYYKILEGNNLIEKEHFSSGSYPSIKAMRSFWQEYLIDKTIKNDIDLEKVSKELDIYIMIGMFENQLLVEVYNLNNKFIILEFEKDEVIFRYDTNLYTLFNSLKGIFLDELKKYLLHIGLMKEYEKIQALYSTEEYNKKFIFKENLDDKFENINISEIENSLSFYGEYLIYKDSVKNKNLKHILIIGNIYTNFCNLFESMKGGE